MVLQAMGRKWTVCGFYWFCFICSIFFSKIQGYCTLNSEGLALLQFRAKVEVDPFGALANWNPNGCDPCMWSGIECLDGKVVMLNQSGSNLEGVLVPDLGRLSHLRILDLSKNYLSGTIPPQFEHLEALEVLELRDNNLSGTIPTELGKISHLRQLLLSNNKFEGSIPVEIGKLSLLSDLEFDDILSTAAGIHRRNRKFGNFIWQNVLKQSKKSDSFRLPLKWSLTYFLNLFPKFQLGSDSSQEFVDHSSSNQPGAIRNIFRRMLIEQPDNLAAVPPVPVPGIPFPIPSQSSGSFPAVSDDEIASAPAPSPGPENGLPDSSSLVAANRPNAEASDGGNSGVSLKLIIGTSVAVLLLIVAAVILFICRRRAKTVVRWKKTRLSGQLQKAFVTGVPKLDRSELESACEDFSNIVHTREGIAILYKGTLSTGVEIAVASTAIASINKWSKLAEMTYRKEIDSLSRVNHKNLINLIGYCQEDEPFTRMLVFEYAPNGSLSEHLHIRELEHLDWNARMRIIMGVAYCLQHMHSLKPPIAHFSLSSKEIFLTDDYAAKIADVSFWSRLITNSMRKAEEESENFELPPSADDVAANIYKFGLLMLEIISGRLPRSKEQGDIRKWANSYLNDKNTLKELVDPTLESFNESQLEAVCVAIRSCTEQNPVKRPHMTEVVPTLRQAIGISPEVTAPRLSPLWWAELEILSSDTS